MVVPGGCFLEELFDLTVGPSSPFQSWLDTTENRESIGVATYEFDNWLGKRAEVICHV